MNNENNNKNDSKNESNGLWNNFLVNLTTNYRVMNLLQMNNSSGDDKEQQQQQPLKDFRLMVYNLKSEINNRNRFNNSQQNGRFRKTWGNFVNFYDDQGKQKLLISLYQLTNYFKLKNYVDQKSSFTFYATLFNNGNYPKTLYSGSGNSWRMRYNLFASGMKSSLEPLEQEVDDEKIIHIGEIHLYFHVERGKPEPLYQNICFFYNQSLNLIIENNVDHQLCQSLIYCYRHLRTELSNSIFIKQLFFPIPLDRFQVADKTVEYFQLRQQDLFAAIKIANHKNDSINDNSLQNNDYSNSGLGAFSLILYLWQRYQRFRKIAQQIDQLPGPKTSSNLLGHLSLVWQTSNHKTDYFQQIFNTFVGITKIYQQQDVGFMRLWIGPTQPVVIIFNAECAESLLTSNVNIDKSREYDFAIPWLGLGLFTSTGDKWRVHRKMLTPAFHFRILESFIPIIQKQQMIMMKIIEDKIKDPKSNSIIDDIRPLITNCALDIICETAMGVSIEAQTDLDSKYSKAVRKVLDLFTVRFLSPWLWNDTIFQLSSIAREQRKTIKFLHDFTKAVIQRKKKEIMDRMANGGTDLTTTMNEIGTKRVLAFLDSLITQNIKDPGSLSDEDIRSEVDTFMSAGQDTSSATVQFALQLIGHHPDVQAKIHDELDSIYGDNPDREIRFEDLREMKYLEKCIKETLRIFPPVLFIARNIREEFKIKDTTIPEGTTCMILFYQLHRDPKCFPNPEKFDPERFSPENMNGRHAFAYTPFSAGPRNCIGQRFAMQTAKALLASILRKYQIKSMVPMDKVELAFGSTVGPKNKIILQFQSRF